MSLSGCRCSMFHLTSETIQPVSQPRDIGRRQNQLIQCRNKNASNGSNLLVRGQLQPPCCFWLSLTFSANAAKKLTCIIGKEIIATCPALCSFEECFRVLSKLNLQNHFLINSYMQIPALFWASQVLCMIGNVIIVFFSLLYIEDSIHINITLAKFE